jgi:acyl-CoA dehydrogenase
MRLHHCKKIEKYMNHTSTPIYSSQLEKVLERVHALGKEIIAPHSKEVDQVSRFPHEAFKALKAEKLLSSYVPVEYGGMGFTIADVSKISEALSHYCASTAMIFAMHQIQVACVVHHALGDPFFQQFVRDLVKDQLLMGSSTTELGVGGDVRTSICAPVITGDTLTIVKQAPVISYGIEADVILVTCRKSPDAAPGDQIHILLHRKDLQLEKVSEWDALGFRGTCSSGFVLNGKCSTRQILPEPYAGIHGKTMHPFAHCIWSSLWLGIAADALAKARITVRGEARKRPGEIPPSAQRLAEADRVLYTMRAAVYQTIAEYQDLLTDGRYEKLVGTSKYFHFANQINLLKITSSTLVVEIVSRAMLICGIAAYRNDSKLTLGRHLRDAYGAALMVSNERILGQCATLQVAQRD